MKKLLHIILIISMLWPSFVAAASMVDIDEVPVTSSEVEHHQKQHDGDSSDCHSDMAIDEPVASESIHDCCEENTIQSEDSECCQSSCTDCVHDCGNSSAALISNVPNYQTNTSFQSPTQLSKLPVAPDNRSIIPPIN